MGVMTTGLGLTSALAAQHEVNDQDKVDANPERVTESVVFIKKDIEDELPFLTKQEEVKSFDEIIRELDEAKERKIAEERERLRQQFLKAERERIERERIERERIEREKRLAAEQRQRELNEARAKQSNEVKATLNIEFSYYVAMCDSGCTGKTATGIDVRNTVYYQGMRIVATDPNVIPTWSIIQFDMNGQKVKAIALDTGGYIKGRKIDMLVGSTDEAWKLGRGVRQVEILRYGK